MRQAAPWVARHSTCILRAKMRAEFVRARALAPSQAAGDPIARRQKTINGVHSTCMYSIKHVRSRAGGKQGDLRADTRASRQAGGLVILPDKERAHDQLPCPVLVQWTWRSRWLPPLTYALGGAAQNVQSAREAARGVRASARSRTFAGHGHSYCPPLG